MPTFKAVCTVDKGEGKVEHTLFIQDQQDEHEAERSAKYYCLGDMNWAFYKADITPIK